MTGQYYHWIVRVVTIIARYQTQPYHLGALPHAREDTNIARMGAEAH